MAYIHSISKLFNIKDENIVLEDKVDTQVVKNVTCQVIFGTLTYQPTGCKNCGIVNRSTEDVIKYGVFCKLKVQKIATKNYTTLLSNYFLFNLYVTKRVLSDSFPP